MNLVFASVILAHILADFYFQTTKMAVSIEKDKSIKSLICHCILYAVSFTIILFVCIPLSINLFILCFLAAGFHFGIDCIKKLVSEDKSQNSFIVWIKNHKFILDQCLHLLSLTMFYMALEKNLSVNPFIENDIPFLPVLPAKPILIILGILLILRPVGILIEKGELWDFKEKNKETSQHIFSFSVTAQNVTEKSDEKKQNAGKMIGYLERVIVFFFLLYHQYGSIAFILTAKSVARFKEIEQNKLRASDYLIGTLLSVSSVFLIMLFLGLMGKPPL